MSAPTLTVVRGRRQRPTLAQFAAQGDIRISIDPHFHPQQCEWCGDCGAITTVRVYGRPDDDIDAIREVCDDCAPDAVDEALAQQSDYSPGPLTVEVAPTSGTAVIPPQRSAA